MSLESVSDRYLARRAATGDGAAFAELARRYEPLLGAAAHAGPEGGEADDARQHALIGLFVACRVTDGQRSFAGIAKVNVRWELARARRDAATRKHRVLTHALRDETPAAGAAGWLPAPAICDPARIVELREQLRERAAGPAGRVAAGAGRARCGAPAQRGHRRAGAGPGRPGPHDRPRREAGWRQLRRRAPLGQTGARRSPRRAGAASRRQSACAPLQRRAAPPRDRAGHRTRPHAADRRGRGGRRADDRASLAARRRLTMTTPAIVTPPLSPELLEGIIARAARADYPAFERQLRSSGYCARPVRLRGTIETCDHDGHRRVWSTTGEPDGLLRKACGNRREAVCPPCAERYRQDAYHLIASGLRGGKGIPDTVAGHPAVFFTLTAPSFGPVHTQLVGAHGRSLPCRARRDAPICEHGVPLSCRLVHAAGAPCLGEPLCPQCFDYQGAVVWNNTLGARWRYTTIYIP